MSEVFDRAMGKHAQCCVALHLISTLSLCFFNFPPVPSSLAIARCQLPSNLETFRGQSVANFYRYR